MTILFGVNLAFSIFLLPETTWRRPIEKGETAADIDQVVIEGKVHEVRLENADHGEENRRANLAHEKLRTSSINLECYFKDLFAFADRGFEEAGLRKFPQRFLEPFQFLVVPQIVWAGISFGTIIAG